MRESINFPCSLIDDRRIVRMSARRNKKGPVILRRHQSPRPAQLIPGMEPDILDYIGDHYDAVVIELWSRRPPLCRSAKFLPNWRPDPEGQDSVVVATQVVSEGSDMSIYEVGFKALNQYNVLQAYDMTVEAAVTKLMWIWPRPRTMPRSRSFVHPHQRRSSTVTHLGIRP